MNVYIVFRSSEHNKQRLKLCAVRISIHIRLNLFFFFMEGQ